MFNKKNQKKQAQLQREEERKKEESRRGAILKDKLYPLLLEETKNIEDAKLFLQVMLSASGQSYMNLRNKMLLSELGLREDLKTNPEAKRYEKLLDILDQESIFVATDIMQSMVQIIDNNLKDENKVRELKDLPLKFFQ